MILAYTLETRFDEVCFKIHYQHPLLILGHPDSLAHGVAAPDLVFNVPGGAFVGSCASPEIRYRLGGAGHPFRVIGVYLLGTLCLHPRGSHLLNDWTPAFLQAENIVLCRDLANQILATWAPIARRFIISKGGTP